MIKKIIKYVIAVLLLVFSIWICVVIIDSKKEWLLLSYVVLFNCFIYVTSGFIIEDIKELKLRRKIKKQVQDIFGSSAKLINISIIRR